MAEAAGTAADLRLQIIARGEEARVLRADGPSGEDAARAVVAELLKLKDQYKQLTGSEYRKSTRKRKGREAKDESAPHGDAPRERANTSESTHRKRPKQPRLPPKSAVAAAAVDPMELPPPASSFPPWAPRDFFRFEVLHRSRCAGSRARVGRIITPHGVIHTPAFVPVGTNGALKALDERQSREAGTQLMFCNTYHLLVHPGPDVVARAGGLHEYINHEGPLITDSGGFQVFSLGEPGDDDGPEMKSRSRRASREGGTASLLRVGEPGATFRSYHDGRAIELSPESSVEAQKALGADIIIPLDELPPYHISRERLHQSVRMSHRWEARSLRAHLARPQQQAMYAVVHGGTDEELRRESIEYLSSLPFDGFAIGGSLGKDRAEMLKLLDFLMPLVPENKPNHLLGIADPESAEAVVPKGIDTLDSCNPTRIARHGMLLCSDSQHLKIKQGRYVDDFGPIDPDLQTIPHSRAYLHHLFKQHEPLYMTLASQHNLMFMNKLMADLRERIMKDEL